MSSSNAPTKAATNGSEEAAALERVRTRLVNTPDAKLPSILHKLLPRLVSKFPTAARDGDGDGDSDNNNSNNGTVTPVLVVESHLVGIFEHILERILLNPNLVVVVATTNNKESNSEWVSSLLDVIVPKNDNDATTTDTATTTATAATVANNTGWAHYQYILPILEVALVRCTVPGGGALSKLMMILEDVHAQALRHGVASSDSSNTNNNSIINNRARAVDRLQQRQQQRQRQQQQQQQQQQQPNGMHEEDDEDDDDDDEEDDTMEDARNSDSSTARTADQVALQTVWERVSWMVVEQIAKQSHVRPILDWNYAGDDWDDWNAPTNYKKIEDYGPTEQEQKAVRSNINTDNGDRQAVYSLFLDFFTFDRNTGSFQSNVAYSRWQFRRQTDAIRQDYDDVEHQRTAARDLMMRDTDVTNRSMLVNQQSRRRQDPTAWSEAELRYWRALQRCLQSYAVQLFSTSTTTATFELDPPLAVADNDDSKQPPPPPPPAAKAMIRHSDREDILRIVTGQPKPVTALPAGFHKKRPKASNMYKINDRKRALKEERTRVSRHSLAVGIALLELLLGVELAQRIISKSTNSSGHRNTNTNTNVGTTNALQQELPRYNSLLGSYPFQKGLPPLPSALAQRVFVYILKAEFDLDLQLEDLYQSHPLESQVGSSVSNESDIKKATGRDLTIFMDLMNQLKSVPNLHVQISTEIYDLIGAQTPATMCWAVHYLWRLSCRLKETTTLSDSNSTTSRTQPLPLHSIVSTRAWGAATELLDRLQGVSARRFNRERQLSMARGSEDQRVHEHREKQALQNPFVANALQARSEAYQLITKFMSEDKILPSSSATPPFPPAAGPGATLGGTSVSNAAFSWDMAVRFFNCSVFDISKATRPALQAACISVLSVYREKMKKEPKEMLQTVPINHLLLPLLKACISSSDWPREYALQWAEDVLIKVDPGLSRMILECLAADESHLIAGKARKAYTRLSVKLDDDRRKCNADLLAHEGGVISFWDLLQPVDKDAVVKDLEQRIMVLVNSHHGLAIVAARLLLQAYDFSVQAAQIVLKEDFQSALTQCGYTTTQNDDMDIDKHENKCGMMCDVCFEEIPLGELFSLRCGHSFCVQCWRDAIEAAAGASSKELVNLSCLRHDCNIRVTHEDVVQVAPSMTVKHDESTLDNFVLSCKDYSFCPGVDCRAVARCDNAPSTKAPQQQAICSLCTTSFCFGCGNEPHRPVACEVRLRYKTMVERVGSHEDSVENKTIDCPNCGIGITKNGGCNHMTCTRCQHEFCWICLSADWQDHVCNVFDSLNGVDDLQRIQFFRRRVETHRVSAEAVRRLLEDFEAHVTNFQRNNRFCDDTHLKILKQSWTTLKFGRDYLVNSYIAAYGFFEIDASLEREFQTHQSQLQVFVEQLSLLCENVTNLHKITNEKDFRVHFKAIRFCVVAVSGYIQRVDSFMRQNFD